MGIVSELLGSRRSGEAARHPSIPERLPASSADHFMYLTRIAIDLTLRDSIRFAGRLDAGRMARAVRLTLDAEPVLGCRFRRSLTGVYWERLPDMESRDWCPVIEKQDIEADLQEFLSAPIDVTAGPQVEACLFRSERDTLGIKISHVVADGAGHMDYLTLLAKTYRELGANMDYRPQPNLGAERGVGPIFRNTGLRAVMRGLKHMSHQQPDDIPVFPAIRNDLSKKTFAIRRITRERFINIKRYSRERGITIGDIMLTAVYRALAMMLAPHTVCYPPVQMTVSLRRYLPSGNSGTICNLSSVFIPRVAVMPGESFEDTLARVHEAITAEKEKEPWLGGIIYLGIAYLFRYPLLRNVIRIILRRRMVNRRFRGIVFSNMGVIEPGRFSFGDVPIQEFSTWGQVHQPPGCLVSVNTFGEDLFFNTEYYSSAVDADMVDQFLDTIIAQLPG